MVGFKPYALEDEKQTFFLYMCRHCENKRNCPRQMLGGYYPLKGASKMATTAMGYKTVPLGKSSRG